MELRELYADHNDISSVEPLACLTNLQTLELGANKICELQPLSSLAQLEELWLSSTAISDVEQLQPLSKLPALQTLRLAGCPLAREAGYRASVLKAMPATLQQLDADPVRPNER